MNERGGLDDILPKVDDIIPIPDDILGKVDDISSKLDDIRGQLADEAGENALLRLRERKTDQYKSFFAKNTLKLKLATAEPFPYLGSR